MTSARLVVAKGGGVGATYAVPPDGLVLGRTAPPSDAVLDDERASRRHLRVFLADGRWSIEDLGSHNGTFVNRVRIDGRAELRSGDAVRVGRTVLRFAATQDAPADGGRAPRRLVGRTFGGFLLLERVGKGSVGVVYRARHAGLGIEAAVKALRPRHAADEAFAARFVEKARAASRMTHANVVRVLDAGEDQGVRWIAMEFVPGGSLESRLRTSRDGRLPAPTALAMAADAARGLAHAHGVGIVHGDVKPENLLLTADLRVKVADFGVAARDGSTPRMGTPAYLAPEAAAGRPASAASDVYGLGATLYRALSGRPPFVGIDSQDVLRRVRDETPTPLAELAPELPSPVVELVRRLMARRPEDRPRTAADALVEIERAAAAASAATREASADEPGSRSRAIVFRAAVVVVAAAVFGLLLLERATRRSAPDDAVGEGVVAGRPASSEDAGPDTSARELLGGLVRRETALAPVRLAKKEAWLALAAQYDGVASSFPDAEREIAAAEKRGAWIRGELERLAAADLEASSAAARWWSARRDEIAERERTGDWSGAAAAAAGILADAGAQDSIDRVEGARDALLGEGRRIEDLVRASLRAALRRAQAMRAGGDVAAAMESVEQWAAATRPHAEAAYELREFVELAEAWRGNAAVVERKRLADALRADLPPLTSALARSRVAAGGTADLAFERARAAVGDAAGLRTSIARRRLERRAARVAAAESAWRMFLAKLAAGEIAPDGAEIDTPAGAARLVLRTPPSAEGFTVDVAAAGGVARRLVRWADMPLDRIEAVWESRCATLLTPRESADFVWLCVELRQPALARSCLARAEFSDEERREAAQEIASIDASAQLPPVGPRRAAELRRRRGRGDTTDAFLLLRGARDELSAEDVFSADELRRFYDAR